MKKETIILLHGALGTKTQLDELKLKLESSFNVYQLNFEGHGDFHSTKPYSISLFAENVHQFMLNHHLQKVHIFGYSMGGYVALYFALKFPKLVDYIITLGTKFDWTPENAQKEIKMLNAKNILQKVPAFARHLEQVHTDNSWIDVLSKTADMMIQLGNEKPLNEHTTRKINHSVLIGIGEKDHMVSLEESDHTAQLLPNGQLKVIPDTKHPFEKVNTSLISELIIDFIST
ncbi:MAG: alpha/beta hydrolase [Saprospiraceae bacterium]|nr:alpha/beta hydrolase [Saprospiraceae bacterium]